MSLKIKSLLLVVFVIILQLSLAKLFYIHSEAKNKVATIKKINDENREIYNELAIVKSDFNNANALFNNYVLFRESKYLKKYTKSILEAEKDLENLVNKDDFYKKIFSTNSELSNKLIHLKSETDLLLNTNANFKGNSSSLLNGNIQQYNYKDVLQSMEFETTKKVDTVKKKGFFSRIGSALKGETDTQKEQSNTILKLKFGKNIVAGNTQQQLENVLKASQSHYNKHFLKIKNNLSKIKSKEKILIQKNKAINALSEDLILEYEKVLDAKFEENKAKLSQETANESKTRKTLIYAVIGFIVLMLILLIKFLFDIFKIKEQLKVANTQIENDLFIKNNLLSTLTHEIKTPVSIISLCSNFLSKSIQDKDSKEVFDSVEYSSKALNLISNQTMDLIRFGNDKIHFDKTEFNIYQEFKNSTQSLALFSDSKSIKLKIENNLNPNSAINYDLTRFYQLLFNTIGNAIKFAKKEVVVSAGFANNTYTFSVKDDGKGVNEIALNQIFDLNYQAKEAAKKDSLSMGLGLYLCKRILDESNGSIHLENHPEGGALVTFSLTV